ncbi:MAG: hypothetical protein HRT99_02940 [Mycoplasmatales bacterium]|nr:hypothetical protein [Mycoplasmatales bacterium]
MMVKLNEYILYNSINQEYIEVKLIMEIKNNLIKLKLAKNEIDSIKYKDNEILNTTQRWQKKFPILFPAIGLWKAFEVNESKYPIRKHGFWKKLELNKSLHENRIELKGVSNESEYPFKINIFQSITIDKNWIEVSTKLSGKEVPFQFGYHPAFNYDLGNFKLKTKAYTIKHDLTTDQVNLDINHISELDWQNVDTFIINNQELVLENKEYNLKITTNLPYIGIWTNGDKYLCIEPWSNLPAVFKEDNSIINNQEMKMKIEIIERNN